jgi:hypothetical protein
LSEVFSRQQQGERGGRGEKRKKGGRREEELGRWKGREEADGLNSSVSCLLAAVLRCLRSRTSNYIYL